eukprot:4818475-Prymnesium_polylepis.1
MPDIMHQVLGLFSFVNAIWLVSIIGLMCTIKPCLAYVGTGLGQLLLRCGEHVVRLLRTIFVRVVVPMHQAGAWEAVCYYLAFAVAVHSQR